jgi:hypothetical protein
VPKENVRKGMPPRNLSRQEFDRRFKSGFTDPAFTPLTSELQAIADAAWQSYAASPKSPHTRKAGPGFADPEYEISVDWLDARAAVLDAQRRYEDAARPSRILLVNGSSRTEHTAQEKCQRPGGSWNSRRRRSPRRAVSRSRYSISAAPLLNSAG